MALMVRERVEQERDIARQWWNLPSLTLLPLSDGGYCLLYHTGQRGGSAGPDVRDAVLALLPDTETSVERFTGSYEDLLRQHQDGNGPVVVVGDVEFHIRASDWFAHQHHLDARYNQVRLHVVHVLDSPTPTRRQDGTLIPTCSLLDQPLLPPESHLWTCQERPLVASELTWTLLQAGLMRFANKSQSFAQILKMSSKSAISDGERYDRCLWPALAEGLGYGRDRAFFRAAGQRLLSPGAPVPEPLGQGLEPAPLDKKRLRILGELYSHWQDSSFWEGLENILVKEEPARASLTALRALFQPLSLARTDILLCNIVLPFAAAVAAEKDLSSLARRAYQLYLGYPRLVSNRVTRIMRAQLQLPEEPGQACLQQGLHHIYTHTCQAKDCQDCLCGGARLC